MRLISIRAGILASAATLCCPCIAHAQSTAEAASPSTTQTAPAPQEAPAADEQGGLTDIIVTAQKRSESLQNVPIPVTALASDQLAAANIQGQVDLPKLTPNLNFTVNSGFASAYIRGVGTQFGNPGLEPSVSVYLDDIYLPRAGSALFSFGDIERIEVLKGPQGTLYGRNATGGAIRLITHDPNPDKLEARVTGTIGSYKTRFIDGMVNVPLGEGMAVRFAARHEENDGYLINLNPGGDADGHTRGQFRNTDLYTAKFLIERDNFKFKLSADYSRKDDNESVSEANLFPSAPEQIGIALGGCASNGFYTYCNEAQDFLNTKAWGVSARVDVDAGAFTISNIMGYRSEKEHNCADIDATGAFVQPVCGEPSTKQITEELQITSNGNGPLRYVVGGYYLHEQSGYPFFARSSSLPPGLMLASNGNNVRVDSIAPYAQVDYDLSDMFSISLGGRYTHETKKLNLSFGDLRQFDPATGFPLPGGIVVPSTTNCTAPGQILCMDPGKTISFNEFTYKATLSFKPIEHVLIYGTVSRGFKSGGFNLPAFGFVDSVRPETLQDYEIGWKTQFGRLRWNGSLFYYDYKDLQITITDQTTGGTRAENAAAARMKGIETDITYVPIDGLELGIGGSYLDAKYRNYVGDAYFTCSQVPGLSTSTPAEVTGKAAAIAACTAQGGLGLALVGGRTLSGKALVNTPKWTGYARAQYSHDTSIGKFTGSVIGNYRSVAYFDSANLFPDIKRFLLSAKVGWSSPDERFSAAVSVENLTNKRYNTIESPQATGGWRVAAPPRWVYFTLGVKY